MSVRLSLRAARLTTAVAFMGAIAGCAVATGEPGGEEKSEGTGATSEAMAVAPAPTATSRAPREYLATLWTETTGGNSAVCTNTLLSAPSGAPPAGLAGLGCTYGASYVIPETHGVYVWACPTAAVSAPGVVPAGGYGYLASWDLPSYFIAGEKAYVWNGSTNLVGEACFGTPDSGYSLVVDEVTVSEIGGGCRGPCGD